ncbi:MAG: HAMP domain-containing protein [Deltaproteobacteria bacterium]|nr:HAMP domain-containing protein [Deltaproteobacteria bacterium]
MIRGRGVQAEILVSLAFAMLAATALLAALLLEIQSVQLARLQGLIGRSLHHEIESPTFEILGGSSNALWWRIAPDGDVRGIGGNAEAILDRELELARAARREDTALIRSGRPWEGISFAAPLGKQGEPGRAGGRPGVGAVALARIPAVVSGATIALVLLADCLIFIVFGGYLLRRWVVLPFRRLARAAESIGDGSLETRVEVEGNSEAAEVARAFNDMSEALEQRSRELEKVVAELRQSNASLQRARVGLDRAERLAAVGSLAAGVAHEVGNPMGALLAFLDLVRRDGSLSAQGAEHLEKASQQGSRVREILRQLLDFSRTPQLQKGSLCVNEVLVQTLALVRAQSRYAGVVFEVSAREDVCLVSADRALLSQVLLNLLVNAADAVAGEREPRVEIEIRPGSEKEGEGSSVVCEVADNGPGVADALRERIFDPFFTTKDPGEGTGLGLANCQRFAEELGGGIEVGRSRLGGASFLLRLLAAG